MKKEIKLVVTLEFSEAIDEDQIREVADNAMRALTREVNEWYLSPVSSVAYTGSISIISPDAEFELVREFWHGVTEEE